MAENDYQLYCRLQRARRGQVREYSSAEELAAYLKVTLETIFLLANHAGIEPLQIAGRSFYYHTDVRKFFEAWASWGIDARET